MEQKHRMELQHKTAAAQCVKQHCVCKTAVLQREQQVVGQDKHTVLCTKGPIAKGSSRRTRLNFQHEVRSAHK